jgi:antitoxin component YwqK of YwqJK toxin-antitoxin module
MKLILRTFAFILLVLLAFPELFAQSTDTVWNKTDKQGIRQGSWKASYDNGNPKYKGFFKDGSPIGEFLRFYEDGTPKARMIYHENVDTVQVTLYYQNNKIAAEGQYVSMKKEGIWTYYSYYSGKLVCKENYLHGLKVGFSDKFYESGVLSEELEYKYDMKNGRWNQFYENGTPRLKGNYQLNLRTGPYLVLYPTGQTQITGQFKRDKMEGKWVYYDENGKIELEIEYLNGIAQNQDKIDEHQKEILKQLESNKGKFPEPDETNIAPPVK